jgi:hypothetical protein
VALVALAQAHRGATRLGDVLADDEQPALGNALGGNAENRPVGHCLVALDTPSPLERAELLADPGLGRACAAFPALGVEPDEGLERGTRLDELARITAQRSEASVPGGESVARVEQGEADREPVANGLQRCGDADSAASNQRCPVRIQSPIIAANTPAPTSR